MKIIGTKELGKFTVGSGAIKYSDPCYSDDTWCAGHVDARNGEWTASVLMSDEHDWGDRVAVLAAYHADAVGLNYVPVWEKCESQAGVDSGQCGLYDLQRWLDEGAGRGEYGEPGFYGDVCRLTHDEKDRSVVGGIINGFGAVSQTGYGDGGYDVFVSRDSDGKALAIQIVYISDEYEEEEGEEE